MSRSSNSVRKKIDKILRDNCDSPRILFVADEGVHIQRHGDLKGVLLVSTKYYTYLIKRKGCRLYCRWLNRHLIIEARQSSLLITTDIPRNEDRSVEVDEDDEDDFTLVTLSTSSAIEAIQIEEKVNTLIHSAQRTAAILELEEAGGLGAKNNAYATAEEDPADDDSESSGSENGVVAPSAGLARPPPEQQKGRTADTQQGLLRMAPSRYIAITALVDGEFADYTTLKNAYMRREEEGLLNDLGTFIKENEGQVEALCEHHYPALIHAAQQCLAISEKDAQLVGEELSGASALVRSAVVDMKQVAASLIQSRSTRDNLVQVRDLLTRAGAVLEYLETAESQVAKEQLIGAVASLRELVRLAAPLAEFALGEYVLHLRVPALTQMVFTHAVQHLNTWLKLLRDQAAPIGKAALAWQGSVSPGAVTKSIVMAPEGNYWWLSEAFKSASLEVAPFGQAAAIARVCDGAAIQSVFYELRREEYFNKYYSEGRAQQIRADLLNAPFPVSSNIPSGELVDRFTQYCSSALGFMLTEDVVYHATSPHIQSSSEVLKMWDKVSLAVADRAQSVSQAVVSDPAYADHMARIFTILRGFVYHAVENIRSVDLSPLILSRVVETLSDNLISWWLQSACMACTEHILSDPLVPLTVNSPEQYAANVSRFCLHVCPALEIPVPPAYKSGTMTLPFSAVVPTIGEYALKFLSQCHSVLILDSSSFMRQSELNNVDEMLLKYIGVLFRTVAESLKGHLMGIGSRSVLQLAVFVTSCSALPVLVSCVEQQFMLHWHGDETDPQALGSPKLLASSAALFTKPVQQGIEKLLGAYTGELEDRVKPIAQLSFWKRQVEARKADPSAKKTNEGFAECMDYALVLIPKLTTILQSTVARSVVGTAVAHAGMHMETCTQAAFSSAYNDGDRDFDMMRQCLKEFQTQCALLIPQWQRRLGELMPDLTAVQRFPLNVSSIVEDLTDWIDRRDAQYKAEKANQPQIMAGLEAVTKGFKAVGNTMQAFKRE